MADSYRVVGRRATQTEGINQLKDFTTFTGANVVATFNENIQVTLEGISVACRRETVPLYTMGDANPRSFAKGKRAITGTMVFSMFDRDELLYSFFPTIYGNFDQDGYTGEEWDPWALQTSGSESSNAASVWLPDLTRQAGDGVSSNLTEIMPVSGIGEGVAQLWHSRAPHFLDEIPPFNITLTMVNEQGQAAQMRVIGVVIINETHGYSVNTNVAEKTCTFFARDIVPLHPIRGKDSK